MDENYLRDQIAILDEILSLKLKVIRQEGFLMGRKTELEEVSSGMIFERYLKRLKL